MTSDEPQDHRSSGEPRALSPADWRALHGLLFFVLLIAGTFVPVLRVWPGLWIAPLSAYAALVSMIPPLRATYRPWRLGRFTRPGILAALGIAAVSCSALAVFHYFVHPDVHAFAAYLPVTTLPTVLALGVLFSIVNALCEEVIFRGILFDAVESQWGVRGAVIGTAFLFGYGHLRGYPPGPLGAVLAGLYGLCLGWLRVFSGGLLLPILVHITADATIFTIVVRSGVL
jgi:membrane protease YdiL (CAAX protease family)